MPTDLHCSNCNHVFSVGWFHYHNFESGYDSARLMVCQACGTQHLLEYALHDRGDEYIFIYNLIVEKIPESAKKAFALWLRNHRKTQPLEALELARNPPVLIASSVYQWQVDELSQQILPLGVTVSLQEVCREPNPIYGPILKDRLQAFDGSTHGEKPAKLLYEAEINEDSDNQAFQCLQCHTSGTLIDDIEATDPCPACKKNTLNIALEWIT